MAQNNEREALKNIIDAWECLSEGSYTPSTIQMWLIANMKPAINSARKVIESISQNEQQGVALKVYQGELCYKSHADDQSYGMWCPVGYDTTQLYKEGTEFYAVLPTTSLTSETNTEVGND